MSYYFEILGGGCQKKIWIILRETNAVIMCIAFVVQNKTNSPSGNWQISHCLHFKLNLNFWFTCTNTKFPVVVPPTRISVMRRQSPVIFLEARWKQFEPLEGATSCGFIQQWKMCIYGDYQLKSVFAVCVCKLFMLWMFWSSHHLFIVASFSILPPLPFAPPAGVGVKPISSSLCYCPNGFYFWM